MSMGVAGMMRGLPMIASPFVVCCASTRQEVPVATAWKNIDTSETGLRNGIKRLQDSLLSAAADMNIVNCGDLGTSEMRQSFLGALQAMRSLNPSMSSAALLAKTRVLGSIQDLRRDSGLLQVGMSQLVAALTRGEANPTDRGNSVESLSRIKVQAEGALGLINYAEKIANQLQRLGG